MGVFAKLLSVVEIGILVVAVGCGMAAAIMIGLTMNRFGHNCLLKADIEDKGNAEIGVDYSENARCNYCLFVQVVALLLAFAFGAYRLLVLCSGKYEIKVFGWLIISILFGALTFFMLIEACLVSVGLNILCSNLLAVYTTKTECRTFQTYLTWYNADKSKYYDGSHFYDNMKVAESASWIGVLLWLSMTLLSIISHCTYKRQRPNLPSTIPVATDATPGPV